MIHKLAIGHFDADALSGRKLVVLRPLDMSIVTRILSEVGQVGTDGQATLGGQAVDVKDGYVVCPWLTPLRNQCTEMFAKRLQQETGCVLYDDSRRAIVTPEQFATW